MTQNAHATPPPLLVLVLLLAITGKAGCAVVETHAPWHADTSVCLGLDPHLRRECVFFSHKSLPHNYTAKCFGGRQGEESWVVSPDFLTPSSTSTGDL